MLGRIVRQFTSLKRQLCKPCNNISNFSTSSSKPKMKTKSTLTFIGASTVFGGLYGYYMFKKSHLLKPAEVYMGSDNPYLLRDFPDVKITKTVKNYSDSDSLKLVLYQYQTCPFCCKVRAFLDYYGLNYDLVEVNPVIRSELKWSKWRKVPIVVGATSDTIQQMNDSSMIVSALKTYLSSSDKDLKKIASGYPVLKYKNEDGKEISEVLNRYFIMGATESSKEALSAYEEERKWRRWADERLVHTISPNVYRTPSEALETFQWFSKIGDWDNVFPTWERYLVVYVGAAAMYLIAKNLKKRHNLLDDVRLSLYQECDYWVTNIKKKGAKFMGGEAPNLSDLAVYGILTSMEGCQAFDDLLKNSKIEPWFIRMKTAVEHHEGATRFVHINSVK